MKTAEEVAKGIFSQWDNIGDGELSLADRQWLIKEIAQALTAYADERVKEESKICVDGCNDYLKQARAEALEEAANLLEGDILQSPNEFEGKTKLKVFELVGQLAEKIRALKDKP